MFKKHYFRYLLSYMTVLLIPLIILTFFYSSRFMKKFYEEIYETVDLELVQISMQMDNEMEAMENIVSQLMLTGATHKAALASSPLELDSTITSLSNVSSSNPFIEDIILILNSNDYIITSTTTCKKSYFFNRIFHTPTQAPGDFLQILEESATAFCIPEPKLRNLAISTASEDAVLFFYPLFTDYQKQVGAALICVKNDSIRELLSQKLQTYRAQIYILDRDGAVISTSGSHDVMRPFLSEASGQAYASRGAVTIGREDYVLRTHRSDISQWTYLAFIPDKQTTFSQVSSIMKEFLLAILIILLIAGFTIFLLQKVNYAPMRRLRDKAKQISPAGTSSDELATISNALDYLSRENNSLSLKLESSITAVKNERLYRLLGGNYATAEEFNLDCSELDLYLSDDFFQVSIILLPSSVSDLDALAQEIKKNLKIYHVYYYLHYLHPNQIVLLLNLANRPVKPLLQYQEILDWLQQKHHMLATMGIGSVAESTDRIAASYMEAASALDYRFVKGNGTFIEFREVLGPGSTSVVYPNQEFEVLRNALLSKNEKNIRTAIRNIIQFMEQQKLPLYLARSICFDLIHLVNEHCQRRKQEASGSPLELSGIETAQEIIEMLRIWSENLSDITTSPAKNADLEEILQFLNANCLRCDFSVYEAALHFNMTLPAFSKYFKDRFGQNVMDYTIHMRIEKAKELLERTDFPLKIISEQTGYYNISSFTRRFKLNQGLTPGDYRKIAKEQN